MIVRKLLFEFGDGVEIVDLVVELVTGRNKAIGSRPRVFSRRILPEERSRERDQGA